MAPLIVAKLALQAGPLVQWFWNNREQFAPALQRVGDFATTAVSDPNGTVCRVGNAIVFGQPDGGSKVIAFIEQTTPKLDHIESTVARTEAGRTAMLLSLESLQLGQNALSSSFASLQLLSMVPLGFTAILPLVLRAQFAALNKRLEVLLQGIKGLTKKFDADKTSLLQTGLDLLQLGTDSQKQQKTVDARQHYNAGLFPCIQSVNYFHTLLSDQLCEKAPHRGEVRLLTRHLSVAVLGVAACHIGLEEDGQAVAIIKAKVPILQQAAKWMFSETAGRDPARFLSLPVGGREVSLAFMADLYQQAKHAGVVEAQRDYTPAEWFEEHRASIMPFIGRLPSFYKTDYIAGLQRELLLAVAAVEEVNRVRGIELLVGEAGAAGMCSREVMNQVRMVVDSGVDGNEHVVWAFGAKNA